MHCRDALWLFSYNATFRTNAHCVCLRQLAERFQEIHYKLYYERSALQAADIYMKAFAILAEWIRACKFINHLDPSMFWGGRGVGDARKDKDLMGSEHKGRVVFDYWYRTHGTAELQSSSLRLMRRPHRRWRPPQPPGKEGTTNSAMPVRTTSTLPKHVTWGSTAMTTTTHGRQLTMTTSSMLQSRGATLSQWTNTPDMKVNNHERRCRRRFDVESYL